MKNSSDIFGNETRDLSTCTAVPQGTRALVTAEGRQNLGKRQKVVLRKNQNVRTKSVAHSHSNKRKNYERELLMHFAAASVYTSHEFC